MENVQKLVRLAERLASLCTYAPIADIPILATQLSSEFGNDLRRIAAEHQALKEEVERLKNSLRTIASNSQSYLLSQRIAKAALAETEHE